MTDSLSKVFEPRQISTTPGRPLRWSAALLVVSVAFFGCAPEPSQAPAEAAWTLDQQVVEVVGERGMVVSDHPLASDVGARILAEGGNAIDAAVAVGFALAVVHPVAGNLGGGGFLVYRSGDGNDVRALDYRETAPAAAFHDMYLDDEGEPTSESRIGHRAVGVPGSVAGMWEMHRQLGSMDWQDLVEPSIRLAESHIVDIERSERIADDVENLALYEASADLLLVDGEAPSPGFEWENPDLAATLARIADQGPAGFYAGETADLIVAEMERGDGLITHEDLETYEAIWREPIEVSYRDRTVLTMPPSSSGGVAMAIILQVLEGFELGPANSAEAIQLQTEAMRQAFIDRNRYLGDPAFLEMPLERLLSSEYADVVRARIVPGEAGFTPPFDPGPESPDTTHYSIVDAAGAAVSVTTTLNLAFGSRVTVAGGGFLLNDEMDDFAAKPGTPNAFGLVQGEANAVEPGKRMLSSMSPSIVVGADGGVELVVGGRGGSLIITAVFHVISNVIDHGMSLGAAVAAPRTHHQALPDEISFEKDGLQAETVEKLETMGYTVVERAGYGASVAAVARQGERWVGVADPRRGGGASAE